MTGFKPVAQMRNIAYGSGEKSGRNEAGQTIVDHAINISCRRVSPVLKPDDYQ